MGGMKALLLLTFLAGLVVVTFATTEESNDLVDHLEETEEHGDRLKRQVVAVPKPNAKSCCTITDYRCTIWGTQREKYCSRYKKFLFWRRSRCASWGWRTKKVCCGWAPKTYKKCYHGVPKF